MKICRKNQGKRRNNCVCTAFQAAWNKYSTAVGWGCYPTNNAKGVARRVGIPAHRNGRNHFRLPETIFCRYIAFCRSAWARMPTLQPSLRLGVGLASPPYGVSAFFRQPETLYIQALRLGGGQECPPYDYLIFGKCQPNLTASILNATTKTVQIKTATAWGRMGSNKM